MTNLLETTIDHAVLVRAPRERVYDAFTTAEGLDAWFTDGTTVAPGPARSSGSDGGIGGRTRRRARTAAPS